jgi:hypothetical protein
MLRSHLKFNLSNIMNIIKSKRRTRQTESVQWSQTFWGRKLMQSTTLALALICTASVALADVKITTRSMASGQSMTSTTYIKGARQRTEGLGYTTIYQCDLKRMIMLNDKTRTYVITPLDGADVSKGASAQSQNTKARKGGIITYHITNTDTGERKQLLGLTAKHFRSKTVIEASEGACNAMNMEMETDGWYVDIASSLSCPTDGLSASAFSQSDCVDEVRYKTTGPANMGYPVMTTTKMRFSASAGMNIPESSSTQEVVDLSTVTVDRALFEIPAGYREVKSTQELGSLY